MKLAGNLPSILVAGVSSNCGKTTVTLGLMAAFKSTGICVQPFKCGPDFIDPTLHTMVTGNTSWNLDIRMCGPDYVKALFTREAAENGINIVEGVMGLFDGAEASSASVSELLSIPVILVVDASAAAESIAAVIKGFESIYPREGGISGIILNKVASSRHLRLIKGAVEKHCSSRLMGALPRNEKIKIPSRHLGLFMGEEAPLGRDFSELAALVRSHVDLEAVMAVSRKCRMRGARTRLFAMTEEGEPKRGPVKIAVAKDRAFCFYYPDNLKVLECAGARLVPFSPLEDERLPGGISGIYLGGGYPELFAQMLSQNRKMKEDIASFSRQNGPLFAECGGFMYLCRSITTLEGKRFKMTGIFKAEAVMQKHLASLGYRKVILTRSCPLGEPGDELLGHEFHYSRTHISAPVEHAFCLEDGRKEGFMRNNTLAGYIHLHLGRTRKAAWNFVEMCRRTKPWSGQNAG